MKINFACGNNKLTGYLNVDIEPSCNPDQIIDFTKPLPIADNLVTKILLFHAIEHVQERFHLGILQEFYRVLIPDGKLVVSYPEFSACARNWLDNYKGQREFWKHTIYGLQRYPSDFHVSLMDTVDFKEKLRTVGFEQIEFCPEPMEPWNTVVKCRKGKPLPTYEEVLNKELGL